MFSTYRRHHGANTTENGFITQHILNNIYPTWCDAIGRRVATHKATRSGRRRSHLSAECGGIGVHSGRLAQPGPSPKKLDTFNFGPARPRIKFGSCRAGPRADPSAHNPARISLNVPCFKRAAQK
jgi:hypothetical protein